MPTVAEILGLPADAPAADTPQVQTVEEILKKTRPKAATQQARPAAHPMTTAGLALGSAIPDYPGGMTAGDQPPPPLAPTISQELGSVGQIQEQMTPNQLALIKGGFSPAMGTSIPAKGVMDWLNHLSALASYMLPTGSGVVEAVLPRETPPDPRLRMPGFAALRGEKPALKAAESAAQKAEEVSVGAIEKAQGVAGKAIEAEGESQLGERADLYEKTKTAQEGFLERQAARDLTPAEKWPETLQNAKKAVAQDLAVEGKALEEKFPEMQRQAVEHSFGGKEGIPGGRTREETKAALYTPTVEVKGTNPVTGREEVINRVSPVKLQRDEEFYNTVHDPYLKISEDLSRRWTAGLKRVAGETVEPAASREAVANEMDYGLRLPFGSGTKNLLKKAAAIAYQADDDVIDTFTKRYSEGLPPEIAGIKPGDPGYAQAIQEHINSFMRQHEPMGSSIGEEPGQMGGVRQPSVQQLHDLTVQGRAILRDRGASRGDKRAAHTIITAAEQDMGALLPISPQLRQEYALTKGKILDEKFIAKVSNAKDPLEYAPDIFNEPTGQRAQLLLKNATPEQLEKYRVLFADYVNSKGTKVLDPELHPPILKLLFGAKHPMVNPQSWLYMNGKIAGLSDRIMKMPELTDSFLKVVDEGVAKTRHTLAVETVKDAWDLTKKLGDPGKKLAVQLRAAKTPEEAAKIAIPYLTSPSLPEESVGALAKAQDPVSLQGPVALQKQLGIGSPQEAGPQAIAKQFPATQTPRQKLPVPAATTPGEASQYSLRTGQGKLSSVMGPRGWVYAGAAALSALEGGSSSVYLKLAAAAFGADVMRGWFNNMFLRSMETPAKSAELLSLMQNPGKATNWRRLGLLAADSFASGQAANIDLKKLAAPPDMLKAAPFVAPDTHRQERQDAAREVHNSVIAGETADIQDALRRGALTTDDVRDVLRKQQAVPPGQQGQPEQEQPTP